VVQWGLAYAAGAWALLQVIGFLADAFHWHDSTKQVAAIALAIGLPIALALAWYHGDRGQQRVSGAELAILSVMLVLGGGILWLYGQRDTRVPAASGTPAAPTAAPSSSSAPADERPSIAVLPFENRSDQQKDAFFVDGIHDDILTQLSKVSALKVISRTSVERFRNTEIPIRDIAGQLGVKSILEGGVQRAGDRVRINVQLIDAGTDAHLWAESYDRELTAANIFAIQSEVAARSISTPATRRR
jgi:TolB-like protein